MTLVIALEDGQYILKTSEPITPGARYNFVEVWNK